MYHVQSVCYTYIHKDISKGHLWRDFFEGQVWILGKNILHYCFVIQHLRGFPLHYIFHYYFFQSEQWKKLLANKLLAIFAMIVTASNTEILNEHTVNHIFQYSSGEAVHQVIKNFEDFQKIQNYVGPQRE